MNGLFSTMPWTIERPGRSLTFNFQETPFQVSGFEGMILKIDQKAFKRKVSKVPRFTLEACISPLGIGPPPELIVPICKGFAQDFVYSQSRGCS
jgi:hypothetical protein